MVYDYERRKFEVKEIPLNEESKKYNATRIEFDSFIKTQYPEVNKLSSLFTNLLKRRLQIS